MEVGFLSVCYINYVNDGAIMGVIKQSINRQYIKKQ